jgi:pimeloyl-ACP methyl ester carboxylesterase
MRRIEGFDFFRLDFDEDGALAAGAEHDRLRQVVADGSATDVLLIAHGFRNDEQDAFRLYTSFLNTFKGHLHRPELQASLARRRFAVGGVFWPAQRFPEAPDTDPNAPRLPAAASETTELAGARARLVELKDRFARPRQRAPIERALTLLPSVKGSRVAQDEFVSLVLSLLESTDEDPGEGGQQVRAQSGSELLAKLGTPVILPTRTDRSEGGVARIAATDADTAGATQGLGTFFQSVFGQVGQLLNFTTWYLMKDRAGTVGARGVAEVVRALRAARPAVKLHLIGHSLGGRLMTACAKELSEAPAVRLDSLSLLEAAFSHYGFSPDNGRGRSGFFRDVITRKVVKGPIIATYSVQDTVVGYAYAIVSRLAGDNAKAIGDAGDEFGGIGRNGTQKTSEAVRDVLHPAGTPYDLKSAVVNNLDGSGGLIKDHGDVTNETITYAVASAVSRT